MLQHKNKAINHKKNKLHLAVLSAISMISFASLQANAACGIGDTSNTIICTEGSSFNNANNTSVSNTATISTAGAVTSAVQMIGNNNKFLNSGILNNDAIYSNTSSNAGQKYGAFIASPIAITNEPNSIINKGFISATISNANMESNKTRLNTATVVGIGTDAAAEYTMTNSGTITAMHHGIGRVNGVEAGGDVEEMLIKNSGTIIGAQANTITKTASTATSFQGTLALDDSSMTTAANIGVAAGIYAEEEVFGLAINNSGTIQGEGSYASGIYTRAVESEIINHGTISGEIIGIAQVSDSGEIRKMTLENSGTISGDILSVNGAALRWWSLSHGEGTSGATIDTRLNINSQYGQANSEIKNYGQILGNFYYSNGEHTLINNEGGSIIGNIDLDQRNTYSALGNGSLVGEKSFTFENAGDFSGDITIRTATGSSIHFIPTVIGSGAGSSLAAPSEEISSMGGVLKIYDGSAATDGSNSTASLATISPNITTTVNTGEYFKVAENFYGSILPQIESDSLLVNWIISKNASNNLVIGVNSVNNVSNIAGISAESAKTLNALLNGNSTTFGAALQSATSANDLERAGQQLRPEANYASMQATLVTVNQASSVIGRHQDAMRLATHGKSGISTGETAKESGFWLQGFGFTGDQDERKNVNGYDLDSAGFVAGADTLISNSHIRIGAAFGYAVTNIDEKQIRNGSSTDIDSYQAILYGSWDDGAWYLDATLGYGLHKYDTKRSVNLTNLTFTGNHDANQYAAKIGVGYPIQYGKITLTPVASLSYINLDQDSYTEKDSTNSGAALRIKSIDTDSIRSGLGCKNLSAINRRPNQICS